MMGIGDEEGSWGEGRKGVRYGGSGVIVPNVCKSVV
jgi:hypothetical protein